MPGRAYITTEVHMKRLGLKGTATMLAAVGCMAGSASAMQHEFNGLLRIKGDFTNFDQAGKNDGSYYLYSRTNNGKDVLSKNNEGHSFFYTEQRARLKYTGTISEDVKLVTQFEIDSRWGDTSQTTSTTRNVGGAMETDQVNLETKNVYMDFRVPYLPTKVRAGLMSFDDSYKGVFLSSDIAGAMTTTRLDKLTVGAGWLRGYDNTNFNGAAGTIPAVNGSSDGKGGNGSMPGRYSLDLGILDAKYAVNTDLTLGGSYYLTYANLDKNGYNILNTLGVNASYNFGNGTIDGFVLYQTGDNPTNNFGQVGEKVSAFAANIATKIKAGPGTARGSVLYASGDDGKGTVHAFQGVNQLGDGNTTSTYSAAQMTMLITNTKYAANTDRALINTVSNYNQGVMGAFLGYDLDIDKAFIKTNLGFAAAAEDNLTFKAKNLAKGDYSNGKYIGTEVNAEIGYRISANLTASVVGGYVVLGDYWKDTAYNQNSAANGTTTPDNPWKTQVVLNLAF